MEIYRPEDAFSLNIWILTILGVWPSAVKHPCLRFLYKLYGYGIQIIYITVLLPPQFIKLYMVRSDMDNLIDSSYVTLTCMTYVVKILLILFRHKEIEEFFQRLHDPIFFPKREEYLVVLKKHTFIARTSTLIFLSMCVVTCIFWIVSPLMDKNEIKPLLLAAWYPYNTSVNPIYACTYASQAFVLTNTGSMHAIIDTMTTNFYVVMVGQIEVLKLEFKRLADVVVVTSLSGFNRKFSQKVLMSEEHVIFEELQELSNQISCSIIEDNESSAIYLQKGIPDETIFCEKDSLEKILNRRTVRCIEHYKQIIKFVNDVTSFFEFAIVFQICVSSFVICTTTYEMTLVSPISFQFFVILQYQICVLVQVFLYSWRGNDFTVKATELKDAVYECAWISVPNTKFRKSLCIIMSPLHIPIKLIVGKVFILSVDTFFKIIKMAYTFYVFLKQLNAQRH